jgi:ribosomal protein S18 acetylase RimI-like enzyme
MHLQMENKIQTSGVKIIQASTKEHFDATRGLFKEYYALLYTLPEMQLNGDLQSHEGELRDLENGKYVPPDGAILLSVAGNEFSGVIALRKLTDEICEMKRLYVRPQYRGESLGLHLVEKVLQKAVELGYKKMRLDTHPALKSAWRLYYSLGFYDIPQYNQNNVPGALFMEIEL